ncbi:DUF1934 domain-containing protein [Carnobacteriaceae bacterium zg-C25]|nr:DUF1934 domain-containing protein [Carnobacteriaceae bacterium zg-C25]
MENKTVQLQLRSSIQQQHDTDVIEKKYEATYHLVNGVHYFRFEDDETGKNTVKIDVKQKVMTFLWEKHAIKRVVFSQQDDTQMHYHLPQGMMVFDVQTTKLDYLFNEQGDMIAFHLHYKLKQDNQLFGRYRLQYTVQN